MSTEEKKNSSNISSEGDNTASNQKKPQPFFEIILKYKNKININYDEFDFQKGESSPRHLFRKRKSDNLISDVNFNLNKSASISENKDNLNLTNTNNANNTNNASNIITPSLRDIYCSQNTNNNSQNSLINNNINNTEEIKIGNKIKYTFDNYLDLVHDSYFGDYIVGNQSGGNSEINSNINIPNLNSSLSIPNLDESFNTTSINNNFKFSSLDLLVNPLRQKFIWETWSPYEIALFECCVCKFNRNFDIYGRLVNK